MSSTSGLKAERQLINLWIAFSWYILTAAVFRCYSSIQVWLTLIARACGHQNCPEIGLNEVHSQSEGILPSSTLAECLLHTSESRRSCELSIGGSTTCMMLHSQIGPH